MKITNVKSIVVALIIALVSFTKVIAQPTGWSGMQLFYITEHSGSNLLNYQLKLTVNTQALISSGMMSATGDDIRFGNNCAGTKQYNYWIESGINTPSTIIWVKLDTIHAMAIQSLYMYYGNPSASAISSIPNVFIGPNSSTDSICCGTSQAVHNCQRGFKFAPTEDLLVTNFGRYEPNGTTRYITLFDATSQALLQQIQVGGPATQWSYGPIANPFWITQSTTYVLSVYQGAADSYYSKASTQIGQQILLYEARFANACTQNTFPTGAVTFSEYGFADLLYWRKSNIANPPTYTLGNPLTLIAPNAGIICGGAAIVIGNLGQGGSYPYSYHWSPSVGLSDTTLAEPLTNASVITTFTETVTDAAGCVATNTVTVTPYNLPIVVAHISEDTLCAGGTVILTGSGASSYVWNYSAVDGVPIAPPASMKYTVTGTDGNGCMNSDSIDVVINPLPIVDATATSNIICAGDMITLNGSGAVSYAWSGGQSDGISFAPANTDTYNVTGTDANGCTDTASVSVTVNPLPVVSGVASFPIICAGTTETLSGQGANTYMWNNSVTDGVGFAASTSVTSYTVTGTDNNSCSNTASVSITVNALPTVVAHASAINICTGDSETLTGSGAVSYVWDNSVSDGVIFVPSGSASYTVTGTDANSCSNTSSISITVNPLPSVSIDLSSIDTLCINWGVINLVGESPLGGTYSGAGVSSNAIDAGIAGVGSHPVTYTYTDGNSCTNTASGSIYIDLCTSINNTTADNNFKISVYPTPTSGIVHITLDKPARITIYNTLDQKIIDKEVPSGKSTINLSEYSKGMYTLKALSGTKSQTLKIIKE